MLQINPFLNPDNSFLDKSVNSLFILLEPIYGGFVTNTSYCCPIISVCLIILEAMTILSLVFPVSNKSFTVAALIASNLSCKNAVSVVLL